MQGWAKRRGVALSFVRSGGALLAELEGQQLRCEKVSSGLWRLEGGGLYARRAQVVCEVDSEEFTEVVMRTRRHSVPIVFPSGRQK